MGKTMRVKLDISLVRRKNVKGKYNQIYNRGKIEMKNKIIMLLMCGGFLLGTFAPKQLQAVEDIIIWTALHPGETPPNL